MPTTTKQPKFRPDRLLKLERPLFHEKIAQARFDFTAVNSISGGERFGPNFCGTRGCAMGQLPAIWPRVFRFVKFDIALVGKRKNKACFELSAEFFGISLDESKQLFRYESSPAPWMKKAYSLNATAKEVAASIRRFIKWKQKQIASAK